MTNEEKRIAEHLKWLHKKNIDSWNGAMFMLEVLGYKVDVNESDEYIITK